jgi:hypothetical protein
MATAKQEVLQVLDKLPDDTTLEDIQYRLYVMSQVRRGDNDVANGRYLTREEVEARMARWIGM